MGLLRQDGKRPDGTTILPWSRGKPLAWDVTEPDTYADAHVSNTAMETGAVKPCTSETNKCGQLSSTFVFTPWPLRHPVPSGS